MSEEDLLSRVLRHEGFRERPYQDTEGVWTIGHGLTYLTEGESADIVEERLAQIGNRLFEAHPEVFHDVDTLPVLEVMSEMVYQLGWDGCHNFKKMWSALADENYGLAANEMLDSKWHKQTKNRCEELAGIIRGLGNSADPQ